DVLLLRLPGGRRRLHLRDEEGGLDLPRSGGRIGAPRRRTPARAAAVARPAQAAGPPGAVAAGPAPGGCVLPPGAAVARRRGGPPLSGGTRPAAGPVGPLRPGVRARRLGRAGAGPGGARGAARPAGRGGPRPGAAGRRVL